MVIESVRTRCAAIASLAVLASASTARADDADVARDLFKQATALANQKDYAGCVAKAEAAWAKFQHAQIRGLEGQCEVELGRYREGATHIAFYEKSATSDVDPGFRAALVRARERVAEVTVTCTDPAADLFVDGEALGKGPVVVFLDPGTHTVAGKLDGMSIPDLHQQTAAGTKLTMTLLATKRTGPKGPDPKPGVPGPKPIWPYVLGASLAGVGVGVGIGTTVAGVGKRAEAEKLAKMGCPSGAQCKAQGESLLSSGNTFFGIGAAGFSVGGAALISTLVYAALPAPKTEPPQEAPKPQITLAPVVTPSVGGLVVSGSF